MTQTYDLRQIKAACEGMDFTAMIEDGFAAYSRGEVVVPPVGELIFASPPGDTHIKYGYIRDGETFVIKIASGFYRNPQIGLPSNSGLMLVFCQKTGLPLAVLLDEGYLTDVRTAVAGAIAAKYLAPRTVHAIGVFSTGIQARMQVRFLEGVTPCRDLMVWGRSPENMATYAEEMTAAGFRVRTTTEAAEVAARCNLIVTATPSATPLLTADMVRPGTHITAMGADTPHKQELEAAILARCDLVVADAIPQCLERGEIAKAVAAGLIKPENIVELGNIINGSSAKRESDAQLTVADLTGVAVQDIMIAQAVYRELNTHEI